MKRNKHFTTAVCMVLGIVILTTAAFANFDNANGYSAYKNSLKEILYMDNFSVDYDVSFDYNNNVIAEVGGVYQLDWEGDVMSRMSTSYYELGEWADDEHEYIVRRKNPNSDYVRYSSYSSDEWRVNWTNVDEDGSSFVRQLFGSDTETTDKVVEFAELLADTFVGDLKNNFVLIGDVDGVKTYNVTLSDNQLPELIRSGMSVLFSALREDASSYGGIYVDLDWDDFEDKDEYNDLNEELYAIGREYMEEMDWEGGVIVREDGSAEYYEDGKEFRLAAYYTDPDDFDLEYFIMMCDTDPEVEYATCTLSVDENGNLLENTLEGTLTGYDTDGEPHSLTLKIDLDFSDIGTTVIDEPDIPSSATIYDYSMQTEKNGYEYTITKNGVTTTRSQKEENQATEREWMFSLSADDFMSIVTDYSSDGLRYYIDETLGMTAEEFIERAAEVVGDGAELEIINILLTEENTSVEVEKGLEIVKGNDEATSVAIIGGADGPTSIFVAGKTGDAEVQEVPLPPVTAAGVDTPDYQSDSETWQDDVTPTEGEYEVPPADDMSADNMSADNLPAETTETADTTVAAE